jgi:hypothetical protein
MYVSSVSRAVVKTCPLIFDGTHTIFAFTVLDGTDGNEGSWYYFEKFVYLLPFKSYIALAFPSAYKFGWILPFLLNAQFSLQNAGFLVVHPT